MFDYDAWKCGYYEDTYEYDVEKLTEEDIKAIKLAREEQAFCNWQDKQESDRCVCF